MKAIATSIIDRVRMGFGWLTGSPSAEPLVGSHWIKLGWQSLGIAAIAIPLIYLGLFGVIRSDYALHVQLIQRGIETHVWPVHFLFPLSVYALSGFNSAFVPLAEAALVVLTVCVLAKMWLTYTILTRRCPQPLGLADDREMRCSHETLLLLVTTALMLSAPIVRPWATNRVYLGQISPNIWHNPTILVCWPFAILLFFAASAFLRSGESTRLATVGLLAAVSVLAKPNYFLAFAPAFGLLALWRFRFSWKWFLSQLVMLPTVAILYWQMTASFGGADAMRPGRSIAWMPLAAWHVYSKSIPLSLLFSLGFPLSYLVIFRGTLKDRQLLTFAWAVMISALVWTACFAEVLTVDGTVDVEFNFSWGAHLAAFVLFLVTAIDLCGNSAALRVLSRHASVGWQAKLPWWMLAAHTASGTLWIIRQLVGKGYG